MQIRKRTHPAVLILMLGFFEAAASAQTVTIRKIADSDTLIPGGTGTFQSFVSDPAIDRGHVAFAGGSVANETGIYTDLGGVLRLVADSHTMVPGAEETFESVYAPSIEGSDIAFRGNGRPPHVGVYLETNNVLRVVAEIGTPAPDGTETFNFFENNNRTAPSVENGVVAFAARGTEPEGHSRYGVYLEDNGVISLVVDSTMAIPGFSGEKFVIMGAPSLSHGNVVFWDSGQALPGNISGIYLMTESTLQRVANETDPIPNGTGAFTSFTFAALDGEDVVFGGRGADGQSGVYAMIDGVLDVVVDRNMTGLPIGAFGPSIENGNVVANLGSAIYTNMGGTLFRVFGSGDTIEGKTVSIAYCGRQALSGNEIVFFAWAEDENNNVTQGIYVATITDLCGNGVVETGEVCDDGNSVSGDGCTETCVLEPGACCLGTACSIMIEPDCLTSGGTFFGSNTACDVPDADGDGLRNECDGCPDDGNKVEPGFCGCGIDDIADSDGDGVPDCVDQCPGADDAIYVPECIDAIPTVSVWGLVVMTLLLLAGIKIMFGGRRPRRV